MNFSLIIPSWDTEQAKKTVANLQKYDPKGYLSQCIISGSNRTEERWGAVEAMAKGTEKASADIEKDSADVLIFCHDDIEIYENYTEYLDILFTARPEIGLIGFHGSTGLGSEDIYRTRYQLIQLARFGPISNMVDAEAHGSRSTVPREVATIDGFFMAIRTTAYNDIGGWYACLRDGIPYHMYDHWMAMSLREKGWKTYLAPVSCKHYGGGTEVKKSAEYETWAKENGFDGISDVHIKGHQAFYERFRGQLPIRALA